VNGSVESIDLYEVLGVEAGATKVEIKKAYHKVRTTNSGIQHKSTLRQILLQYLLTKSPPHRQHFHHILIRSPKQIEKKLSIVSRLYHRPTRFFMMKTNVPDMTDSGWPTLGPVV
jgi:curved DNA-binding protein CbpA